MSNPSSNKAYDKDWQENYVSTHNSAGHMGYCFAWLDSALCPQKVFAGKCCYRHEYPTSWTQEMINTHKEKLSCMLDLWSNETEEVDHKKRKRTDTLTSDPDVENQITESCKHVVLHQYIKENLITKRSRISSRRSSRAVSRQTSVQCSRQASRQNSRAASRQVSDDEDYYSDCESDDDYFNQWRKLLGDSP